MRNVLFKDETKEKLVNGVQLIADAVGTTYGPNGKNVIIRRGHDVHVTKDGMTVATYVTSEDPVEQMAIDLVKEAAQKAAKDVGDGTTTTVMLTNAIVQQYKNESNPIEVQRKLQKYQDTVIDYLQKNKREIESFEDVKKVATIAANNDTQLGDLVARAFDSVGKFGTVSLGSSQTVEDTIEVTKGVQIESGYASPFFINTDDNMCVMDDVLVYITSEVIKDPKVIQRIAEDVIKQHKSLLVIATKLEDNLQQALLLNKQAGRFESCFVKTPLHGIFKDTLVNDIKLILGESMTCKRVEITRDTTTLIGCEEIDNSERIEQLKRQLQNTELVEVERDILAKRLSSFTGGVCTIKIGGYSEAEIKEKHDRIEDAVCATKAALDEGVLPGGGVALYNAAAHSDVEDKFWEVLATPFIRLTKSEQYIPDGFWDGKNLKTGESGDLYKLGVIEPFLVTKNALLNAISTATIILTNECSIIYNYGN